MKSSLLNSSWLKAAVAGAVIALAALGLPAASQAAGTPTPTPTEVTVIPPGTPSGYAADQLLFVGATGYLHDWNTITAPVWTRFSDGHSTAVTGLSTQDLVSLKPDGGDVAYRITAGSVTTVNLTNFADQTTRTLTLPTGHTFLAAQGSVVVARVAGTPVQFVLDTFDSSGAVTTKPLTGLPTGTISCVPNPRAFPDSTSTVILCGTAGHLQPQIVDMQTGAVTAVPTTGMTVLAMDSQHIVGYAGIGSAASTLVYSRPGLIDGTDVTATAITGLAGNLSQAAALVGNHLIAVIGADTTATPIDVPLNGDAPRTLYSIGFGSRGLSTVPDGKALVLGGTNSADVAVHRLSADDSGNIVDDASLRFVTGTANGGVSMSFGMVRHVESAQFLDGSTSYTSFDQALTLYPGESATQFNGSGGLSPSATTCARSVRCVRLTGSSYYGTPYMIGSTQIGIERTGGSVSPYSFPNLGANAQITDVSDYYVLVRSATKLTLVSLAEDRVISSMLPEAAALWGSMIWRPTPVSSGSTPLPGSVPRQAPPLANGRIAASPVTVPGSITGINLDDASQPAQTVTIGASCTPSELQANDAWIYWTCGSSGPAGAHNLSTGANVSLPAGHALLGDGFAVIKAPGQDTLKVYAFTNGSLANPVTVGSVPATSVADDRQYTWTVDRDGGDIAYVDAADTVHVVDPGVMRPAAVPTHVQVSNPEFPRSIYPGQAEFFMNRPVDSWTFTVKSVTGATVRTITGGPTRRFIYPAWSGTDDSGSMLPSGGYSWALTTSTADGPGVAQSGQLQVWCGTYVFRSYGCDGQPEFLGIDAAGNQHWFSGTSAGPLQDLGSSGQPFPGVISTVVPWGDFNNDGDGDVMMRDSTGVLWAVQGGGVSGFSEDTATRVGSGWSAYDTLLTTGDVDGDGQYDMIARDASGKLYLYPGRSGGFAARTQIGSGWNIYRQIVGVGDITGDGHPDLVATDANGVLWRYNGNGAGGFAARVQIGTGWGAYNRLIGIGDLNHDGHNDLIGRDSAGALWLFPGNGAGAFGARVQVGSGFKSYTALY